MTFSQGVKHALFCFHYPHTALYDFLIINITYLPCPMNICICGGGNLGHAISGYLAAKPDVSVSILTRHPQRWGKRLEVTLPNGNSITGEIDNITDDPSQIIPQADIVFICLPGMYIRQEIEKIKPHLKEETILGTAVSSTGFFFQAHDLIPSQPVFGFQRVPFIARTIEYGHRVRITGLKSALSVVIENYGDPDKLVGLLNSLLDTPVELLDNFYEVSLSNSNPLLHTSRLYTMWKDWHEGVFYARQSLFYEEWTPATALLYIDMDNEFQKLLSVLGVRKGAVPTVLDYYESQDAASLCHKIRTIPAFKGLKSPMIETPKGWIPDTGSRYFTEDFGYGLRYIYQLTKQKGVSAPNIEKVYEWGERMIGRSQR